MTTTSKTQQAASLDNLKPLLDERAELHASKKRIEERIKKLDEEIRPMMVGRGAVVHNGYQFEVTQVPGRKSYDYKAMEHDGIDLEQYQKIGAPSTRFNIKRVNEL